MVLVKGFYDRVLTIVLRVSALGGGLVTELLGRPLSARQWSQFAWRRPIAGRPGGPSGTASVWQAARTGWVAARSRRHARHRPRSPGTQPLTTRGYRVTVFGIANRWPL